jgi:hypothetical protein
MRRQKFGPGGHFVGTMPPLKDLRFGSWALGFGAKGAFGNPKPQMFNKAKARLFPRRTEKFERFFRYVAVFCSPSGFDAGNEAKIAREGDGERAAPLIHTDRARFRFRDDRQLELLHKCARLVFDEIFGSRRSEICAGHHVRDWADDWRAWSSARDRENLRQFEGAKKKFLLPRLRMNFLRMSSNSTSTVLHCRTATLVQRITKTYLLNLWQGWVIVNTLFSAMGVRILRGNS